MRHFFMAIAFSFLALQTANAEFLPKSDLENLKFPVDGMQAQNFTEQEFKDIIGRV